MSYSAASAEGGAASSHCASSCCGACGAKSKVGTGDASACCHEPRAPNIKPGAMVFENPDKGPGVTGPGGGRIGAVLVSRFIKPGTVSHTAYNHYSQLRSIEDFFDLPHLGYAGQKGLKSFGKDVFTERGGRER